MRAWQVSGVRAWQGFGGRAWQGSGVRAWQSSDGRDTIVSELGFGECFVVCKQTRSPTLVIRGSCLLAEIHDTTVNEAKV